MTQGSPQQPAEADREFVARLRAGDEAAFSTLVERYHVPMVRLATAYVPSYAVAEEVAQEAWLGVLNGLGSFEGRSSLKTWIFRILTNIAKTRGAREHRSQPAVPLAATFSVIASLNSSASGRNTGSGWRSMLNPGTGPHSPSPYTSG